MKITTSRLKQIISEELNALNESAGGAWYDPRGSALDLRGTNWFGTGFKLGTSVNLKKDINIEGQLIGEKGQYKLVIWAKGIYNGDNAVTISQNVRMFKLAKGFTQSILKKIIDNPEKGTLTIETADTIVPQGSTGKTASGSRGESTVGELTNIRDLILTLTGIEFAWDLGTAIGRFETALAAFTRPNLHPSEKEAYRKELDESFVAMAIIVIVTAVTFGIFVAATAIARSIVTLFTPKLTVVPKLSPQQLREVPNLVKSYKDVVLSDTSSANATVIKALADDATKAAEVMYGEGKGVIALPITRPGRSPATKKIDSLKYTPNAAKIAEREIGGKLLSKAGEGVDGNVYIMRLDDPIGIHKEVALKILKPTASRLNMKATRWILDKRASLDADTAKYLPEILKIGELSTGEKYIVMEQLAPLPPNVMKLFVDTERNIAQKVWKDPDMFDGYIDVFITQIRTALNKNLTGIMGPRGSSEMKTVIMKYASNPKSISSEANTLFNKIDWSKVNMGPDSGQKKSLKKIVPGVLEYLVQLRKTTKFSTRQREKVGKQGQGGMYRYLKELDSEIERFSSTDFWKGQDRLIGRFSTQSFKDQGRAIPRNLGDRSIADVVTTTVAETDPAVKNAVNAMQKLDDAGIKPFDLHSGNWLIRPSTGDIVMADYGRFDVKWVANLQESLIRNVIRQIIESQ
jgi:hypothetical protein